jgi:hypothetical protein
VLLGAQVAQSVEQKTENLRVGSSILSLGTTTVKTLEDFMHSDKLYDTRIIERNVKKGLLTKKDYEKYLGGIKDSSGELEVIEITDELNDMPKAEEYKD